MPQTHDLGLPAHDGTHSRAGQADATSPVPAAPLPPPDQTRTPETHGYSVLPGHLLTASMPSVQDALPRGVRARRIGHTAATRAHRTGAWVATALPPSVARLGERMPAGLRRGIPWLAGAGLLTTGFLGGAALGHDGHHEVHGGAQVSQMMMHGQGQGDH